MVARNLRQPRLLLRSVTWSRHCLSNSRTLQANIFDRGSYNPGALCRNLNFKRELHFSYFDRFLHQPLDGDESFELSVNFSALARQQQINYIGAVSLLP